MKINYLLYSVAFASAFAACSDELTEVANAPVNDALAGRPVVGNVALSVSKAGESATRLNPAGTGFVKGDKIKLFLMDEFNLGSENWNANFTEPRNQWNWTDMYTMVDYIHTNYIYVAQEDGGADFENQSAQLVEGNYFAFYQEDESYRTHEITNRQDLWAYINPSPVLAQKAANVYANMENDFYLDYQQVYRDDDADPDGKLTMEMGMKPVMNRVKFTIGNLNNAKYRVRDIVIRRKDKKAVPTLAYIRPVSSREWNNNVMNDDQNFDWETVYAGLSTEEEKEAFNNKWTLKEYHEDFDGSTTSNFVGYNGGATAFTQEDARAITYFETTASGKIPYGLGQAEAEPAFAYTVKFPGEGHELNAHAPFTAQERVDVFFALPIFASDFAANYEILVEGDYWDITKGTAEKPGDWVSGYWTLKTPTDSYNAKWFMESAFDHDWTTDLGQDWPTGTLTIDFNDMHLYGDPTDVTVTAPYRVSTSEEILNVLKNDNILFKFGKQKTQIELNGVNIAFNQAIVDQIKKNASDWKKANPSATPYEVEFTASSAYTDTWKQWQFEQTVSDGGTYGGTATDDLLNSALVVTVANVLDLPVNFEDVPVTFAAPQKVSKDYTATKKVVITADFTVADGVTFDGADMTYIMEDINVDLGKKGVMKGIIIWKEHQVVTVKGTSKDAKFAGRGYGKVILPRVDEYTLDSDGNPVWGTGFNCVIDVTGYTISNGVLSFPVADTKKVTAFSTPEYAPTGYDHAKNYQYDGTVTVEATSFKPGDEVK